MAKDVKARKQARLSVMAIANVVAALVDTMREMDVPNDQVHHFLDVLDRLNVLTLDGAAGTIMGDIVMIVRATVPDND